MAEMKEFDDGTVALVPEPERYESIITLDNTGMVSFLQSYPADSKDGDPVPDHVWLAEGICYALQDQELADEIQSIVQRAHMARADHATTDKPPLQ